MDRVELRTKIEAKAHELGFALVGVARASPSSHGDALRRWIAQGKHGEMDWLADCVEERVDVRTMLRNARSVIAVGRAEVSSATTGSGPEPGVAAAAVAEAGVMASKRE